MKTKISIYFDAPQLANGVATILEPAGCGPDVANIVDGVVLGQRMNSACVKLDQDDPRVATLMGLLRKYGIKEESYDYTEYSEEDLQNARLLLMRPDLKESVATGPEYGTKYDMTSACTNCFAGARQTSVIYVNGTYLSKIRKHRAIGIFRGDVLVDGGMVKKLKEAGITGITFGDVRARLDNGKWTSVARDQILIHHTMPPMRGEFPAKDDEDLCKVCRRGGRMTMPKNPYRAEDLVGMKDFNLTWEWFGDFWHEDTKLQRYAKWPYPFVLVTPKVMNIFREAGVNTFQWTPVVIEE